MHTRAHNTHTPQRKDSVRLFYRPAPLQLHFTMVIIQNETSPQAYISVGFVFLSGFQRLHFPMEMSVATDHHEDISMRASCRVWPGVAARFQRPSFAFT